MHSSRLLRSLRNGPYEFASTPLSPLLTPQGHLLLAPEPEAVPLPRDIAQRVAESFAAGAGPGLLHLGTTEVGRPLPPAWAWWRDFAARYVTGLCATPEGGEISVATPLAEEFEFSRCNPNRIIESRGRGNYGCAGA